MSVHSHSSFSGGSTASSTRRSEEGGGDEWDEDPSFSSAHFHTSTPLKSARPVRLQRSPNAEEEEHREGDEGEGEEEGMLRASDTESLGDREDNSKSNTRLRLTRRSLSLSSYQPTAPANTPGQQTFTSSRPFSPSATTSASTPRTVGSVNLQPSYPVHLAPGYTPSTSTGSSTLVDREDHLPPSSTRTAKGKGREDVTIRPSPRAPFSTVEEDEQDDASSSSPRPLRSKPRRGVELSTYISSHTSTPPPTSRSSYPPRSSNPSTPLAPGAYPPTARKPLARRSPPSSSISHDTPPPTAGSRQVHDAFQRYITGPSGALIHSAERRAAAAAAAMVVPPSAARRKEHSEQPQREPPTPHPAGYYAFEASNSLPVDRDQRRRKEPIPSSEERRRREVTWREDVAGGQEGEEEEAPAGDSPSHRPSSRAGAPSKLEKTLRHMSQLQRETEGRRRIFEAPPPPPPPNLDEYFAPTAEYEEELEQEERARARNYEGDYSSEDDQSEQEAPRLAGRSAIDFAMARSFAVSSGDHSREEEAAAGAELPTPQLPPPPSPLPAATSLSPPRTSRRSPFRPPSPPSPSLPELPPLPSPQSSPTKPRAPLRRSAAAHDPPRHPPPPQPQPSPPRAPPQPSPPRAPIVATSPPRTSRQRRPSFDAIPTSSTPPRRYIAPPAPAGTPLAVPARHKSLSSSLQATRADPTPTPRRRASSLSPSRSPRSSTEPPMLQHEHEHDDSLPAIVADLAIAVRALSSSSGAELRRDGLPAPRGGSLAGVLARRKKESEGRTKGLEEELRVLESRVGGGAAAREDVLNRLEQAQEVEKDLGAKIDDMMRSIEQMGQVMGAQVANVVQDTLHDEARQRTSWFAIAFLLQLFIFLIFTRITASRNSDLYQTIYYDPFSPSLFHLSSAAYSDSASVLPQTLELFGPHLGGASAVGVVKSWFGGRLREIAAWGVEQSAEGRGWVPS